MSRTVDANQQALAETRRRIEIADAIADGRACAFPRACETHEPNSPEPNSPDANSPDVNSPDAERFGRTVFGKLEIGEYLIQDPHAEVRREGEGFRAARLANGSRESRTFANVHDALAFIAGVDEHRAKVIAFAEPVRPGLWNSIGFAGESGFADVYCRRQAMPVRLTETEFGRRHRNAILSFAPGLVKATARKRAGMITSGTGSFTVAVDVADLESRERFAEALRNAKGPSSYVRGSRSRAGNSGSPIGTLRDGFEPVKHTARRAVTEPGEVIASVNSPNSQLPADHYRAKVVDSDGNRVSIAPTPVVSDRGRTVAFLVTESNPEPKRSLRIEVPSDAGDDVVAEVVADLAGLRGRAIPCANCSRRYPFGLFVKQVTPLLDSPEQQDALRELVVAFRAGEITDACPTLWNALGIYNQVPWVDAESDESGNVTNAPATHTPPFGVRADAIRARHGTHKGEPIYLRCRMRSLASQYAWRAAFRFAYASAKRGTFANTRQDSEGEEIADWGDESFAFDSVFALAGETNDGNPEDLICERVASGEHLARLTEEIRARARTTNRGERLEMILRLAAREGHFPSGAEVERRLGYSARTARQDLRDIRRTIAEIAGG